MEHRDKKNPHTERQVCENAILGELETADIIPSELYVSAVALRAQSKAKGWFRNKGINYAKLCVGELIRNTHETLYIFNQKMDSAVADTEEVYEALKEAVYRGVEIRLIIEEEPSVASNSKALQFLMNAQEDGEDVQIKTADESLIREIKQILDSDYHFMVGDGHMVRIEMDKKDFRAIVSYDEDKYAKQLHDLIHKSFY